MINFIFTFQQLNDLIKEGKLETDKNGYLQKNESNVSRNFLLLKLDPIFIM